MRFIATVLLTTTLLALPAIPSTRWVFAAGDEAGEDYRAELESWHRERVERLTSEDGWLTLVGLSWLKEGDNRLGADPEADVPLPAGKAPADAGLLRRAGWEVRLHAPPEAGITHGGEPVTTLRLTDDGEGEPTVLALGSLRFHVLRRGERLGVRVKDVESPTRRDFRGIETYPADPRWRLEGRFEPYEPPRAVAVPNVLGSVSEEPSPGAVVLEVGGETYRLDALDGGDGRLFLIFGDATNRAATYGGGRFLYTDPPAADGTVVVDFNRAYNPPCAFTPYATCPLPPRQNRLSVAVEAGEKRYGHADH